MRVAGPEVDKSDNASLLTVDEITQEVQSRRDSVHHSRPGSIRPSSPRSSMLAATDEEDTDDGEGNSSPNIAERRSIFSAYDHSAGPTPSTTIEEAAIVHGPPSHNPLTTELRSDLVESGSDEDEVDFEDELTESEYDEEDEDFEEREYATHIDILPLADLNHSLFSWRRKDQVDQGRSHRRRFFWQRVPWHEPAHGHHHGCEAG